MKLKSLLCPAASSRRFVRPIFILAPPRSGSTLLYECLTRTGVFHLPAEADLYWWQVWPYERTMFSDHVGTADAREGEVDDLFQVLYRQAVITRIKQRRGMIDPRHLLGTKAIRYLDKTIANCFHLEVLGRAFPDARFVFLVRDPRAGIASMIEGWPHLDRFGKARLTPILRGLERRTIEHWTYPAPPGWQRVVEWPLAEICAWSWQQHVEAVLRFFERSPLRPINVTYEALVSDPKATVRNLVASLELPWSRQVADYARRSPVSGSTVSTPSETKWKAEYRQEIESVTSMICGTATKIGYELSDMKYH